ncbi:Fe(2+) transporter [Blyttiomyces sp. JEL0837]|nr:Fe(2+) transporter [Blyttiomyces sp. JEL0837]
MSEDDYESLPNSSLYANLMAGAFAGITEHTVMFPFDSIKTRMQVITTNPQAIYSGVTNALSRISTTEGSMALWRGVNSVVLGAGPAHALHFATYEHCKEVFGADEQGKHHLLKSAAAAAIATIAADGFMNPFDVIKQRLQLPGNTYNGVFDCARTVMRKEGFSAFYISYPTTLTMTIPFQSIHFAMYEYFRKTLNRKGTYDPVTHVISGGLAGAIAAAATTPLDVMKTLLQTKGTNEDPVIRKAGGMSDAMRIIYQRHGLVGFFKGIKPRILTHMPSTAICWTTYEFLKHVINKHDPRCESQRSRRMDDGELATGPADNTVTEFASYEDYLDSQITPLDLYYLEDKELARQLVELGYRGSGEPLKREEFESRKKAAENFRLSKRLATKVLASQGKELSGFPFLQALAEREEANRNGKLTSILFIRTRNPKGQEISGYIDYAHRLKTENFEPYFNKVKTLMPRSSDMSFYNWETQTCTSNATPNFQIIADNENGLLFKNKRDRKIINVDPKEAKPGDNTTRIQITTNEHIQVVIYDHLTRRKA